TSGMCHSNQATEFAPFGGCQRSWSSESRSILCKIAGVRNSRLSQMTRACGPTSLLQSMSTRSAALTAKSARSARPAKPCSGLGNPDPECAVAHREPAEHEPQPATLRDGHEKCRDSSCQPHDGQQAGDRAVSETELALHIDSCRDDLSVQRDP